MLDEMGIKLIGWPTPGASVVPAAAAAVEHEQASDPAAAQPTPRRVVQTQSAPVSAAEAAPAAALAQPSRSPPVNAPRPSAPMSGAGAGATVLAEPPRRLDRASGTAQGGWLIVADMPPGPDGRHGEPFAGDAGQLFEQMLRALRLRDGALPVHLMRTHRGVASGQPASPAPLPQAFAEALSALSPRVVLAMGPLAAQNLLGRADPLGKLRGRAEPLPVASADGSGSGPAPWVVATYHPAYLLRNPADKGRAWADLCLAASRFDA